jgi:hypothetical protein
MDLKIEIKKPLLENDSVTKVVYTATNNESRKYTITKTTGDLYTGELINLLDGYHYTVEVVIHTQNGDTITHTSKNVAHAGEVSDETYTMEIPTVTLSNDDLLITLATTIPDSVIITEIRDIDGRVMYSYMGTSIDLDGTEFKTGTYGLVATRVKTATNGISLYSKKMIGKTIVSNRIVLSNPTYKLNELFKTTVLVDNAYFITGVADVVQAYYFINGEAKTLIAENANKKSELTSTEPISGKIDHDTLYVRVVKDNVLIEDKVKVAEVV